MFNFSRYEKIVLIILCSALLAGLGFSSWKTQSNAITPVVVPITLEKTDLGKTKEMIRAYSVININTAQASELEKLDGIGPALAQRIIAYRMTHGLFKDKKEILNVPGIGPKIYADIEKNIMVE